MMIHANHLKFLACLLSVSYCLLPRRNYRHININNIRSGLRSCVFNVHMLACDVFAFRIYSVAKRLKIQKFGAEKLFSFSWNERWTHSNPISRRKCARVCTIIYMWNISISYRNVDLYSAVIQPFTWLQGPHYYEQINIASTMIPANETPWQKLKFNHCSMFKTCGDLMFTFWHSEFAVDMTKWEGYFVLYNAVCFV